VELVEFPARKTLFELILSQAERREVRLPIPISDFLAGWSQLEAFAQQPLRAWLPATFDFR
jgi:hypothetical protein